MNGTKIQELISAFTKALKDGNDYARWNAAIKLTHHYLKKEKYKEIEELLEHKDAQVRDGTAHELRQAGAGAEGASLSNIAPLVPALVRALKDKNVKVRRSAADALSLVSEIRGDVAYWEGHHNEGLDLTPAIPSLTKALEDDDSIVRYYVAGTIQHAAGMGVDISQSIPALAKALEDSESLVRQHSVGALEAAACLGQDITPALSALGKISEKHSAFIYLNLRKGDWKKVEELMKSKDVGERRIAVVSLQASTHLNIFPLISTLGQALKDEVDDIRWAAAKALRHAVNNGIDISSAVSNLMDALSDPFTIVIDGIEKHIIRRNASAALTAYYINKKDWENVERLLKHKDEEVKRGAHIALNNAVEKRKDIPGRFDNFISTENLQDRDKRRKRIEELLRRDEDWTRVDIAQGLAASAHNGLDISSDISDLTSSLESKEEVLRRNAAETLGDAANEGLDISLAIPSLAKLLSDKDRFVIWAASWGLVAHYMNKKDWEKIEALLNHETDNVKEGIAKALSTAAAHKLDITTVIPGLVHALSDKNSSVRFNAVHALWEAGMWSEFDISPAIPALEKALEDEDENVRSSAKSALETIKRRSRG